jgi:hypothetical protein
VGTGVNAVSAANTEVGVYLEFFSRTVHAVLNRTNYDTGITVYALFFINPYDRSKGRYCHFFPPFFLYYITGFRRKLQVKYVIVSDEILAGGLLYLEA